MMDLVYSTLKKLFVLLSFSGLDLLALGVRSGALASNGTAQRASEHVPQRVGLASECPSSGPASPIASHAHLMCNNLSTFETSICNSCNIQKEDR